MTFRDPRLRQMTLVDITQNTTTTIVPLKDLDLRELCNIRLNTGSTNVVLG
jgi:hypothetical protein